MLLSVVIPTYNEEGNIRELLDRIEDVLKDVKYEVIICDDSTDETIKRLEEYIIEKNRTNIKYFHRDEKKGLASAVVEGFKLASGKYISVMDADLQHPPVLLKEMLCAMKFRADMCIPTRFITNEHGGLNIWRKFVSLVARKMANIFIYNMRNITDPTSGIFCIKREVVENADLNPIGWKIMMEVMAKGNDINKVIEVPYKFMERFSGESKLNFKVTKEYIKHIKMLMKCQKKVNIEVEHWSTSVLSQNMEKIGELYDC